MTGNNAREVEVVSQQWTAITNWENEGGAILPNTGILPATEKRARSLSGMSIPSKQPTRPVGKGH